MDKFKVGDKLVRTKGDFRFLREGDICLVTGLKPNGKLEIDDDVGYCYSPDNFESYVEEGLTEVLTPLQASEAILSGESVEVITSNKGEWKSLLKHPNSLTIKQLKSWKFRIKQKTMVINGVEVPAPLDTAALGYPDKVYGLNFSRKSVYDTTGHTDKGLFWATKEDAQQVLDAMLIPFNDL